MGQLLYDKELGCLRHPQWELAEEFVHAIHDVFETNNSLVAYPPALARVLHPFQWRRHMRGWRTCFRIGTHAAQYCSYRKDVNAKLVQLEHSYAIFGKSNVLRLHGDCMFYLKKKVVRKLKNQIIFKFSYYHLLQ